METYSFDGIAAELDRLAAEIVALNTQPFSPVPELSVISEEVSENFLAGPCWNPRGRGPGSACVSSFSPARRL
jgi:hypothetical protein